MAQTRRLTWSMHGSIVVLLACVLGESTAPGCPFCPPQSRTLNEQYTQSDVALLAQWVSASRSEDDAEGTTTFKVVRVARSNEMVFQVGDRVTVGRYREGQVGNLFLLSATVDSGVAWDDPQEVSETAFNYIVQSPSREQEPQKRLRFYLRFLEFSDPVVANDAFAEFAKSPYEDVAALKDSFPREKLRRWVFEGEALPIRTGLYGMMLGLCGDESDAQRMEEMITLETQDFRLGIDGVMGGYLLLTGTRGLDVIDKHRLQNDGIAFNETFAAMQALRFYWSYGGDEIPRQRLRQSMRLLLDRPKLTEIVITDLARWEDWTVQDRLMELYDQEAYSDRFIRRSIAAFLLVCLRSEPEQQTDVQKKLYARTREHLASLREKDPQVVRDAERMLRFQ